MDFSLLILRLSSELNYGYKKKKAFYINILQLIKISIKKLK